MLQVWIAAPLQAPLVVDRSWVAPSSTLAAPPKSAHLGMVATVHLRKSCAGLLCASKVAAAQLEMAARVRHTPLADPNHHRLRQRLLVATEHLRGPHFQELACRKQLVSLPGWPQVHPQRELICNKACAGRLVRLQRRRKAAAPSWPGIEDMACQQWFFWWS
jgi:hypothetical protein